MVIPNRLRRKPRPRPRLLAAAAGRAAISAGGPILSQQLPCPGTAYQQIAVPHGKSSEKPRVVRSSGETQDTESSKSPDRSKPTRKIHQHLQRFRRRRASDHSFLGIPQQQYVQIVQLTAERLAQLQQLVAIRRNSQPEKPTTFAALGSCAEIHAGGCTPENDKAVSQARIASTTVPWTSVSRNCRP